MAGGAIAVILIPVLIMGGVGATKAITVKDTVNNTLQMEALPTSNPEVETTEKTDSVTPPDRVSDQTGATPEAAEAPQEDKVYYIQDGDTLTKLSAQFGMSVDYIAEYNAVRDVDVISEGSVLRTPFIYEPPPLPTP